MRLRSKIVGGWPYGKDGECYEVFRPDEPINLASNAKGKVIFSAGPKKKKLQLVEMPKKSKRKPNAWLDYALSVDLDLPADYSSNLDDYLYGTKSMDDE